MSQSFKVGDLVRKRAGYEYPGIIVSVFTTRAGAVRYVVEADHPDLRACSIFSMASNWSLEPNFLDRNASSRASSRSPVATFAAVAQGGRYQSEADIDEDS